MNIGLQISLWYTDFISFRYILRSTITGLCSSIFNFVRNFHTVFIMTILIFTPTNSVQGIPFFHTWPTLVTFLIITILTGVKVLITQSCLILCDPMDCSPSGSSVHGILWARILEWVTIPFSREYSQPRDWTQIYCIAGGFFTIWAIRDEVIFYMGLGLYFPDVEWFWILFNIPDGHLYIFY